MGVIIKRRHFEFFICKKLEMSTSTPWKTTDSDRILKKQGLRFYLISFVFYHLDPMKIEDFA